MAIDDSESAMGASGGELVLPGELTIYTVGELHPQWLAWVDAAPPRADGGEAAAEVRADAVDQVDAAGIQLLVALERAASARGRRLVLQQPSAVLRRGLEGMGLGGWPGVREAVPREAVLS